MFTLPSSATDDDLRGAVMRWLRLLASGEQDAAEAFLNSAGTAEAMNVKDFLSRVSELTSGGRVTTPSTISRDFPLDAPLDLDALANRPIDLVYRWIPGPKTTEVFPGMIGEIYHAIPVNGEWSRLEAAFYICCEDGLLSLKLRDICAD